MEQSTRNLGKVIKINESAVKDHLGEMLDDKVNWMCNAEK